MEPSEASSVPTNPTNDSQNDDASSALQPSLPSSNGDPDLDPAPTDLDQAAQGVREIEEQFGEMGLKENKEENEEVVESGLKEKEEEDGAEGDSDGGERERKEENGKSEEEEESDGGENENENGSEVEVEGNGDELEKNNEGGGSNRRNQYPVRPEAEDCSFYLKTGTCKFGSNCKFNHPVRRKNNQVAKEKVKEQEELPERPGQTECKYYLRSGGCKFGKACRYNHTKGKTAAASVLELNFVGLPIRMGERECPYYMRTGSCKYGANCRFNHPDPTASGGFDPSSGYGNGEPVSLPGAPQSPIASWSSPRSLNETAPFVPMMLSPTQGVPPQNSEWNGYQAPVYLPPERTLPPPPPPPYVMNSPVAESNIYTHHQPLKQIEEFPERPGQPECSYFIKTGDCKFKSNCKYHHPKNRTTMSNQIALSDKGLPLRPDQNICTYYSRYGICKFGPACKFDHSVHPPPSNISGLGHQHPYGDSATMERAGTAGSRNRSDSTIQQPV
ncbi:zinc finger CCCH domain-containing protein 43 [Ziziphus jujuba]|uniref:Zinc finger CCCH domain-containing protein 43 n=1 Tax=Ziziphus jujuba TaxID=326968 RepID=A0A6P3ZNY1_ZIZJJ|nr:zinc finger CCCH domain-containing protein 43 [Ziziphus jujuba]